MKKTYSIRFIVGVLIAMAFSFSFWNDAQAQSGTTAPNPGGPITIDGNTGDWDFDADFYSEFIREYGDPVVEGNIYIRVNFATNTMYVLVLTTNPTPNLVVPGDATYVLIDGIDQIDYWDFAYIDQSGSYANGWEASFPITVGQHNIVISSNFNHDSWLRAKLETIINVYPWDYGDLPDSYGTTLHNSETGLYGPKHSASFLRLGLFTDGEGDGQPDTNPVQDDLNERADEDGVLALGNWRSGTPTIQYTVRGCSTPPCYLSAWIDWGEFHAGSGSWRPDGEFNLPGDILFLNREVSNGTDTFIFDVPDEHFAVTFNARFRLCDTHDVCSTPFSSSLTDAPLGEVEDYQWEFDPTALTLKSFSASPSQTSIIIYLLAGSVLAIMILGTATFIKKRNSQ